MYYFEKQSYNKNKTMSQENLMNLVAVTIVLAIVRGIHQTKESTLGWFKPHSLLFQ